MEANCQTNPRRPMGVVRKEVFLFFPLLWKPPSSWDFNNSCAPFKIHTCKVAGSRPRTTRLKGPRAHTVRQISGISLCMFTRLVQRYLFHLLLSLLRDGLLKFNLIPVKQAVTSAWHIYWNKERKWKGISLKSPPCTWIYQSRLKHLF